MGQFEEKRREYIDAVTRGEGFMPWQTDRGYSDAERAFRADIEERKYALLNSGRREKHPVLLSDDDVQRIRRNIRSADWAREWFEGQKRLADYVIAQEPEWISHMIPALTPTASYSFVCPHCFGIKSGEGESESGIVYWDYRNPDKLQCRKCDQEYPSPDYPETARLVMPRSNQVITYYLNEAERADPDNRSCELAYRWARHPIHPSFSGIIRERKIQFMIRCSEPLALMYLLTGEPQYAVTGTRILSTLAESFPQWLYHDYWDGVADCNPLYAAWHDRELPLVWKRHLCKSAFEKDTFEKAAMMQTYWGAGRVHPSTGAVTLVDSVCRAYDMLHNAVNTDGSPVWLPEDHDRVERDLIIEWAMEAEPYLGGPGHADLVDNKTPRIYAAFATVARVLSVPLFADVAIRGYEGVRDKSFGFDGFSHESPAYNNMYLSSLLDVPDRLHGFSWPEDWEGREGVVDKYGSDPMLYLMMRGLTDILRPDSRLPTLSDTKEVRDTTALSASENLEMAAFRFPETFLNDVQAIYRYRNASPRDYSIIHMRAEDFDDRGTHEFAPPELFFPAWGTAILRNGAGPDSAMLALSNNPPGGHRHLDNLGLYWINRGRTVLGDLGYLSAAPIQRWHDSTYSHNLVIVDDEQQRHRERVPGFRRMITTPHASVVELESNAYEQCSAYRRLIVLIKGPGGDSICVDVFRVRGGNTHRWRAFSEFAANTSTDGSIDFDGLSMPTERPIPDYGPSSKPEHIFGIRDVRSDTHPPRAWSAIWSDREGAYRLHMRADTDRVEAGHGPGQETWEEPGRRVRYVDAIREGTDIASTFTAVHESGSEIASLPVSAVELIDLPDSAGPDACAIRIESKWGTYTVFSDCDAEVRVDGIRFCGAFGLCGDAWQLASGASVFTDSKSFDLGVSEAVCQSSARRETASRIAVESSIPATWPSTPDGVTAHAAVDTGEMVTGLPIASIDGTGIDIAHFPVPNVARVRIEAVAYRES